MTLVVRGGNKFIFLGNGGEHSEKNIWEGEVHTVLTARGARGTLSPIHLQRAVGFDEGRTEEGRETFFLTGCRGNSEADLIRAGHSLQTKSNPEEGTQGQCSLNESLHDKGKSSGGL